MALRTLDSPHIRAVTSHPNRSMDRVRPHRLESGGKVCRVERQLLQESIELRSFRPGERGEDLFLATNEVSGDLVMELAAGRSNGQQGLPTIIRVGGSIETTLFEHAVDGA